ncbi:FAD-dependent oxidoreductase [Candidatus Poribacteria bacterium]|nr:FAD-dependent oxidoreductase [Candidatus Poribacteria bacterium]
MFTEERCDILVVGGGGAGVTSAVLAARAGARVSLVSKEPVGRGDTCIASGIMSNGIINPADNARKFVRDLVLCGEYLNDPALVQLLVERSGEATDVLEEFGMVFRRDKEGRRTPIPFPLGGHSVERSLVALTEGNQIGNALRGALYSAGVKIYEEHLITDLLTENGRVIGALGVDLHSGEFIAWSAKSVILASGGCGTLFAPFTSNMKSNTGDGFALAFEAGAELRDMEQAQFIFGIAYPESMIGVLCGEPASAGYFGRLLDSEGKDILSRPGRKTRGQVAAAIARTVNSKKTSPHGGVFLDLSENEERLGPAYRKVLALSRKSALDAVRFAYGENEAKCAAPWEVVASFHYHPGGVKVDQRCQSTVRNLYAIGQVQGGLFGADRLGSVSLTELFVFGKIAAGAVIKQVACTEQPSLNSKSIKEKVENRESSRGRAGAFRPIELKSRLQRLMWKKVGPVRTGDSLQEALHELDNLDIDRRNVSVPSYQSYNTDWIDLLELEKMVLLARIIARCALERKESRGGHVRIDYPERDDTHWLKNLIVRKGDTAIAVRTEPVGHAWSSIKPPGFLEQLPSRLQEIFLRNIPRRLLQRLLQKRVGGFIREDES